MADNTERRAVAAQLTALAVDGRPLGPRVAQLAKIHGVTSRTIYRWHDLYGTGDAEVVDGRVAERFELTLDHLTVVAHERTLKSAWKRLSRTGLIDCSYATFALAAKTRTNPTLLAAALEGHKGMVNNRQYMEIRAPHRNHTWHLDHTQMDLWVIADHRTNTPTRPWVTGITDSATGMLFAVALKKHPTSENVTAALVEAATIRPFGHAAPDLTVGGAPQQIILDNAAEHFAKAMKEGVERLNWVIAPTGTFASWQNGKAESAMRSLNAFAHRMPGGTHAGKDRKGLDQFAPPAMKRVEKGVPDDVAERMIGWAQFLQMLQLYVDQVNTEISMDRLGGQTRLEAWEADTTPLVEINPHVMRAALLPAREKPYIVGKNGLQVKKVHYIGTDLEFGRSYMVRGFFNTQDHIEVFETDGTWVTTAYRADRLTEEQRNSFLGHRRAVELQQGAIEHGAQRHRDHEAALINEHWAPEEFAEDDKDPEDDGAELPPVLPPVPVHAHEPATVRTIPDDDPIKKRFSEKYLPKDLR